MKKLSMKTLVRGFIASFAAALLLTGCHTATRQYSQKEEYKFVSHAWGDRDSPDSRLNEIGQQGWTIKESIITYTPHAYTGKFLFTRPAHQYAQKQEYKFVQLVWDYRNSPDGKLNEMAQQGWTVKESSISYTDYSFTGMFLFMRPAH